MRALRDGNPLLRPFGFQLQHTPFASLTPGKYVKWHAGHFTAAFLEGNGVRLVDGDTTTEFRSVADVGRVDQHLWYKLQAIRSELSSLDRQTVRLRTTRDVLESNKARAFLIRQTVQDRKRARIVQSTLTTDQLQRIAASRTRAMAIRASQLVRPSLPEGWPAASVPAEPDFDSELCLPPVDFLRHLNGHVRDTRLVFYPDTHTYLIDGRKSMGSVTGLIHAFAQPFVETVVISKMKAGRRWPRVEYLRDPLPESLPDALSIVADSGPLRAALTATPLDREVICELARRLAAANPTSRLVLEAMSMTDDDIRKQWEHNRTLAARQGTWMH